MLTFVNLLSNHVSVGKFDSIRKTLDWNFKDFSICNELSLAATFSPDAVNAEANILKQELIESLCLYYNIGAKGRNIILPASFVFPIVTVIVGNVFPAWYSIFH